MKVLIIGIVASGKSTLAKRLSKENNINYYEIDSIVYDDVNNRKRSESEQYEIIMDINKQDTWIIEGTLRKNLDYLLDIADKVVYIDIPLKIRKRRILYRFIKQKLGIEKCNYRPTFKMLRMMYMWTYNFEENKLNFETRISKYNDKLVRLCNVLDVCNYKLI